MRLGDVDRSGRRRPIPVPGEELLLEADTVIAAIGEHVETGVLEKNGIRLQDGQRVRVDPETGETGLPGVYAAGDCVRGPATVVEAIADAKTVSRSILKAEGIRHDALNDAMYTAPSLEQIPGNQERRAAVSFFDPVQKTPLDRRKNFDTVIQTLSSENAARESERCLRCSLYCSKCVEVCPNRANVTLYMDQHDREAGTEPAFSQATQILHIDDFCNECGNCETFCPHEGKPYQIKPTLFSGEELFMASENSGFYYKGLQSAGPGSLGFGNPGLADPGIANPGIEEPAHRFVCRLNGHVYDMYIGKSGNRFSGEDDEPGMTGMALIARNILTKHPYLLT
jgi:putative selenate reductase